MEKKSESTHLIYRIQDKDDNEKIYVSKRLYGSLEMAAFMFAYSKERFAQEVFQETQKLADGLMNLALEEFDKQQ